MIIVCPNCEFDIETYDLVPEINSVGKVKIQCPNCDYTVTVQMADKFLAYIKKRRSYISCLV
jgi:hypothetical protein